MKKEFSTYLDVLRISAAALVFFSHLSWQTISGGFLWQLQPYGHSAVIVFFVLSGFVIQYVADTKEKTLLDYSVARFSRLYSVVLPAILLTIICDAIGTHHNLARYEMARETMPFWRAAGAALFLSQSWNHLSLFSNDAYWSLPHEFWYYSIFAAALYLRGWQRIAALLVTTIIAGPGILLLFPIWLAGAMTYKAANHYKIETMGAWAIWLMSAASAVVIGMADVTPAIQSVWYLPNAFSGLDFLLGAAVAANIYAASFLSFGLARAERKIAWLAGMTFALYLFHLPLLHLAATYLSTTQAPVIRGTIEAVFALVSVYLLSFITERQKDRWRTFFRKVLTIRLSTGERGTPCRNAIPPP